MPKNPGRKDAPVANLRNNPVAAALQDVLASTYTAYLLTHNYHWNIEGRDFYSLHKLLDDQYNELFAAVDEIAERIRALDAYAMPGGLSEFNEPANRYPSPIDGRSGNAESVSREMLAQLVEVNEEAIKAAQKAKRIAEKAEDDESVDLTVSRITAHQKAVWMLKSSLKK